MARRRKRRARRNPAGGIGKRFTGNLKELMSRKTLVNASIVAAGSVATPVAAGILEAMLNRAKAGMIKEGGMMSKALELFSAAGIATVAMALIRDPKIGQLMLLGGASGVVGDVVTETALPALGLRDYLTANQLGMRDYVTTGQLRRSGVADYLQYRGGMRDYASADAVASARTAGSQGEDF